MTAVSTLFAPIITPFNFWLWGTLYCRFAAVKNDIPTLEIPFAEMLDQIVLILGIPIILGVIVSRYIPRVAKALAKPSQVLSILLFLAMVIVSVNKVLTGLDSTWAVYAALLTALLVVIIHNASVLGLGYSGASLMKVAPADRRSLTIETGIQNSGLGLALLLNPAIFDPTVWHNNGGMVIVTALW